MTDTTEVPVAITARVERLSESRNVIWTIVKELVDLEAELARQQRFLIDFGYQLNPKKSEVAP